MGSWKTPVGSGDAGVSVVMGSALGQVHVLPATGQGLVLGSMAGRRQLPMVV